MLPNYYLNIHAHAVTVEKRKRRALELRAKDLKRFTDIVFQRYDARFIELASEVSS